MSPIDDPAAWPRAWRACGARRPDAAPRDALVASYQEAQRAYHTLEHTNDARRLFEARARRNLVRSIARLEAS